MYITGMVLDSPFTSLVKMCQDVANEHYSLPKFLVSLGLAVVNGSIKSRIGVDLFQELAPLTSSATCSVGGSSDAGTGDVHHWQERRAGHSQESQAVPRGVW